MPAHLSDLEIESVRFGGQNLFSMELAETEMLELGIWLERAGAEYYRFLAQSTSEPRLREFFLRLVGIEWDHEEKMQGIYRDAHERQVESLGREEGLLGRAYLERLQEMAIKKIFPKGFEIPTFEFGPKPLADSLLAALEAERRSAALFKYLYRFRMHGPARETLLVLYEDERQHISDIEKIMREIETGK